MRRSLPIHWPSVRSVPGNSLGPITISATTPIRRSSPQPMSNIALSTPRGADHQAGAPPSIEPVRRGPCPRQPVLRVSDGAPAVAGVPLPIAAPTVGGGWWSMVFTGSTLGSSSAFSSSDKPFLNDLMPLAKSPINSEILPRPPNSNRPTASTMIQCQILMEPIGYPPQRRTNSPSISNSLRVRAWTLLPPDANGTTTIRHRPAPALELLAVFRSGQRSPSGLNLGVRRGKNKDCACSAGRRGMPRSRAKRLGDGGLWPQLAQLGTQSSSVRSGGGARPRSRSPGSSGSSSSRKAGSSDGTGTEKPGGSRPSSMPAPLSSSSPGRSPTASSPKCDRNASLVP